MEAIRLVAGAAVALGGGALFSGNSDVGLVALLIGAVVFFLTYLKK